MARRTKHLYNLYWSGTLATPVIGRPGQPIGSVVATSKTAAIRKAPKPWRRYPREIDAEDLGPVAETASAYHLQHSNAAMGYRGSRGHRVKNPRQMVNAKLARMPNGRYKIFVSPGAMAKMQLNPKGYGIEEKEYRTEAAFRKALRKATADGTLVYWYATDHGWVIVTRPILLRR